MACSHIEATQRAAPVQQHGSTMAFIQEAMGFGRAATADPDAEAMSDKIKQHMQALTQDATVSCIHVWLWHKLQPLHKTPGYI